MTECVRTNHDGPRQVLAMCIFAAITALPCAVAQKLEAVPKMDAGDPKEALAALVAEVQAGKVESVDIFYIPRYVLTDMRITPERIRHDYSYKISIQRFRSSAEAALLVAALKKTAVRPYSGPADVRWGAVFSLGDGKVREVYMDGFGRFGQIDGAQVSFQGGLYDWFRQLTRCLK